MTTDPQAELLIQVDEHNQIIGPIDRKTAHDSGNIFYRTIYVLIINNNGEVLLQRRSATKDLYPNCWDISVGGHVNFGHSYLETATREVGEELGISVNESDLISKGEVLVKLPKSNEFFNVFEYYLKPDQKILANVEEVEDTKWMTIENIKKSMAEKSLNWYERPLQVISALY
jgi:isopentenyldiphosphate isomerase